MFEKDSMVPLASPVKKLREGFVNHVMRTPLPCLIVFPVAALALAGCPDHYGLLPIPADACAARASHGGFYLDPAKQGKRTRIWRLAHMIPHEEGVQPCPPKEPFQAEPGPDGGLPALEHDNRACTEQGLYLPVHIGAGEKSAGKGARVLELDVRANTEVALVVTEDAELPRLIAKGKVKAQRGLPPSAGISPAISPLDPIDWWGPRSSEPTRFWYTAEHVTGHVYLVRTGEPPPDDVYRMMGSVSGIFMDEVLAGCNARYFRFEKMR